MKSNVSFVAHVWLGFMLLANLYAYVYMRITGDLNDIYHGFSTPISYEPELAFFLISLFYLYIYISFSFASKIRVGYALNIIKYEKKRLFWDYVIIFTLLIYILEVYNVGLGTAGGEELESLGFTGYIFVLFRVDYFAILYVFLFKLNRASIVIIALVLLSSLMRGWVGDLLLLIILVMGVSTVKLKSFFFTKNFIFLSISLAAIIFLVQVRSFYRLGDMQLVLENLDSVRFDYIEQVPHEMLMRFQQIYSLVYFLSNYDYFIQLYSGGDIKPLYAEGIIPSSIYKWLTAQDGQSLGFHLANHNRVLISGRQTAFTPGVIAHIFLDVAAIIYVMLIPIISGLIVSIFMKNDGFKLVMFIYLINLFSFGWANAFFSFALSVALLFAVIFVTSNLYKVRVSDGKVGI